MTLEKSLLAALIHYFGVEYGGECELLAAVALYYYVIRLSETINADLSPRN